MYGAEASLGLLKRGPFKTIFPLKLLYWLKAASVETWPMNMKSQFDVGFSYCWINLEALKYSLEQYIGFVGRQAFIHYCGLHQEAVSPETWTMKMQCCGFAAPRSGLSKTPFPVKLSMIRSSASKETWRNM